MANIEITNIDNGTIALRHEEFRDDLLTFIGATTVLAGTLLARDSVSGKLIPFVVGGVTNEDGIPKAVITYDVTAAVAGDVAVRALVAGTVNKDRLIVNADGTGLNITTVILDMLRDYGIPAVDVEQLGALDNQ